MYTYPQSPCIHASKIFIRDYVNPEIPSIGGRVQVLGRNERDICGISVDTRVFPSGLVVFSKRYSNTQQNELGI